MPVSARGWLGGGFIRGGGAARTSSPPRPCPCTNMPMPAQPPTCPPHPNLTQPHPTPPQAVTTCLSTRPPSSPTASAPCATARPWSLWWRPPMTAARRWAGHPSRAGRVCAWAGRGALCARGQAARRVVHPNTPTPASQPSPAQRFLLPCSCRPPPPPPSGRQRDRPQRRTP